MRSVIDATGVLKGKTRRALDSTLLDDAVATQDTVTQLIAAIRRVRRVVPGGTRSSFRPRLRDQGKPLIAWDDPVAKAALVDGLVSDALRLLGHSRTGPEEAEATRASDCWPGRRPRRRTRTTTAPGRSPRAWPLTGSFRRSIPKPATCTSHALNTATATRPTSPSSPRPASSPPPRSPRPTPRTADRRRLCWPAKTQGSRSWPTSAYGSGEIRAALGEAKHRQAIKPMPHDAAVPGGFTAMTSSSTTRPAR